MYVHDRLERILEEMRVIIIICTKLLRLDQVRKLHIIICLHRIKYNILKLTLKL